MVRIADASYRDCKGLLAVRKTRILRTLLRRSHARESCAAWPWCLEAQKAWACKNKAFESVALSRRSVGRLPWKRQWKKHWMLRNVYHTSKLSVPSWTPPDTITTGICFLGPCWHVLAILKPPSVSLRPHITYWRWCTLKTLQKDDQTDTGVLICQQNYRTVNNFSGRVVAAHLTTRIHQYLQPSWL